VTEAYYIVKWVERHSNAEQRRSGGRWIVCPTAFDSLGYNRLVQTSAGVTAFGVYVALAELAGKLPTAAREDTAGILANDQGALSLADLCMSIRMPRAVVASALNRLSDETIGWVTRMPTPRTSTTAPAPFPAPVQDVESSADPPDGFRNGSEPRVRAPGSSSSNALSGEEPAAAAVRAREPHDARIAFARRLGVPPKFIAAIREAQVSTAALLAHWCEVRAQGNDIRVPGAVIGKRIIDAHPVPKLTPAMIQQACKHRVLTTINGVPLRGTVTHNNNGVMVDGQLAVSAADIPTAEFA
jgi:hypothetical protein